MLIKYKININTNNKTFFQLQSIKLLI